MNESDFESIWLLLGELFPAAPKAKNKITKRVWAKALEPYSVDAVSDNILTYARGNKFFPDVFDITGSLPQEAPPPEKKAPPADTLWMERYLSPEYSERWEGERLDGKPSCDGSVSKCARECRTSWQDAKNQILRYADGVFDGEVGKDATDFKIENWGIVEPYRGVV